jgi:hypothetical protein
MALLPKKQPAPLTFEERLLSAHAQSQSAVSVFDTIANDLEIAASDKENLAFDIDVEINHLLSLIDKYRELGAEARRAAEASYNKAQSIRALVAN